MSVKIWKVFTAENKWLKRKQWRDVHTT